MNAVLKTAALAATLCLGVAGAAQASTTTQSYTFGTVQFGPSGIITSGGSQNVAAGTTLTFSVTSGNGVFGLSDDGTAFRYDFFASSATEPFTYTFADASVFSFSGFGWFGPMTVEMTFVTPDPVDPDPVVPLPASLPLLAGALGLSGLMARRRKAN